jgi:Na+-transporting NADH:ubiquinone oxidoreductase subunit NqrB
VQELLTATFKEQGERMGRHKDPRIYQIVALCGLMTYGIVWLGFGVTWERAAIVVSTCLAIQYVCTRFWRVPRFDPRSALISGLSLSLLLRTGSPALAMLAASITVSSKFFIRIDDRHVFNPTNFGLVVMMLVSDRVWVSPGQWGNVAFVGFLLACLGMVVVNRAARSDVTYAFLAFYVAIVIGRTLWLGDPVTIALHQLQSGGLLLFAFFMVSDPKTTPDSRAGRIVFALFVAIGAAYVQFALFRPNGVLWSLVLCAITVPFINRLLPGRRYEWINPRATRAPIDASAAVIAT